MEKRKVQFGMLAVGLITVLAIVLSQIFCSQQNNSLKKETRQEQNTADAGDESDSQVYYSPLSSLPSSVYATPNLETFCLFEILFNEKDEPENYDISVPLPLNKFFHTLFRAIISPNAP